MHSNFIICFSSFTEMQIVILLVMLTHLIEIHFTVMNWRKWIVRMWSKDVVEMHKTTGFPLCLFHNHYQHTPLENLNIYWKLTCLKPFSLILAKVKWKFKILRIGQFWQFQRVWTQKICEILWVIIKNSWIENSTCQLT